MGKFNYCPIIEIGDVFTRIDRNGKVWKAEVVRRSEYFVEVKKTQPYQIKVGDEYGWHYEDAEPTYERCQLNRKQKEITDGFVDSIWGKLPNIIKVDTNEYFIQVRETYSKYPNYDKQYSLIKD